MTCASCQNPDHAPIVNTEHGWLCRPCIEEAVAVANRVKAYRRRQRQRTAEARLDALVRQLEVVP